MAGAGLRTLMGFVSRSLVQRDRDGRYEMHELLRQYAAGRLSAMPGEVERARDAHGVYYAQYLKSSPSLWQRRCWPTGAERPRSARAVRPACRRPRPVLLQE